jgi:hypothetical protein
MDLQEVYPYMGPVNALYQQINPFVFALFRQARGKLVDTEAQRMSIMKQINDNDGRFVLKDFVSSNNLEGR